MDGSTQEEACPGGTRTRTCVAGQFGGWSVCFPDCDLDALENNDSVEAASLIPVPANVPGLSVCTVGDRVDHFRFVLEEDSIVRATTTADDALVEVYFVSSAGVRTSGGSRAGLESSTTLNLPAGEHYLAVSVLEASTGYRLQLTREELVLCAAVPPNVPCVECFDRFEPNNTVPSAPFVELDRAYEGLSLCAAGDRTDVYGVELPPYTTDVRVIARYAQGSLAPQRASIRNVQGWALSTGWRSGDTETSAEARVYGGGPVFGYLEQDQARTDYSVEFQATVHAPGACGDGADNDGDGHADHADPGCAHIFDDDESDAAVAACANGVDDDGDGATDWPEDRDCVAAGHGDEARPCTHDGPVRWLEVPDDVAVFDTTVEVDPDRPSVLQGHCNPAGTGEEVIAFTIGRERSGLISTDEWSGAPPSLSLRTVCGLQESEVACDRSAHFQSPAQLTPTLPPGTYFLLVEGQRPATRDVTVRIFLR